MFCLKSPYAVKGRVWRMRKQALVPQRTWHCMSFSTSGHTICKQKTIIATNEVQCSNGPITISKSSFWVLNTRLNEYRVSVWSPFLLIQWCSGIWTCTVVWLMTSTQHSWSGKLGGLTLQYTPTGSLRFVWDPFYYRFPGHLSFPGNVMIPLFSVNLDSSENLLAIEPNSQLWHGNH